MNGIFRIYAVCLKQARDSLKNKFMIMIFLMFPVLAFVFRELVEAEELAMLLPSFITMNIVMVPVIFMSSIVAEEKEKHSLQMLMMSNVKAWEYLVGIGVCVFVQAFLSSCLFLLVYEVPTEKLGVFLLAIILGILCSLLLGAMIAMIAKNQMSVGPITAPISMLIGLLPMFAEINEKLKGAAHLLFSYHIRSMIASFALPSDKAAGFILLCNLAVLLLIFTLLYRHRNFSDD